jgi:hypothetical protein
MSDLTKEIAEITARYNQEIAALNEKYLKRLEEITMQAASTPSTRPCKKYTYDGKGDLKEKIETHGLSYFS